MRTALRVATVQLGAFQQLELLPLLLWNTATDFYGATAHYLSPWAGHIYGRRKRIRLTQNTHFLVVIVNAPGYPFNGNYSVAVEGKVEGRTNKTIGQYTLVSSQ